MSDTANEWLKNWFMKKSHRREEQIESLLDSDYIQAELIDSFTIIELIADIESHFDVRFTPEHFQDRRFTSISGLSEMISEIKF